MGLLLQPARSLGEVAVHPAQGLHMAFAGQVDALRRGLPAGLLQQGRAQRLQAGGGLGRQSDAGRGCGFGGGVLFVPDVDHWHIFQHGLGQCRRDMGVCSYVFRSIQTGQIVQEQHYVSPGDFRPGPLDADLLHQVAALAQAGGVDHMHRHTFDLDGLLDLVAGGARHGGDDGQFGPGQGVEQRRLARIGLPGDNHLDALTQQRALPGALHHRVQVVLQFR